MTPAELHAIRLRFGWTQSQLCRTFGYSRNLCYQWETGCSRIPPEVAAWGAALPPVPQPGSYKPTRGGLRQWMLRHDLTCAELADMCGVAEQTVCRWLLGITRVPPGVAAWLRAGAPPYWWWAPPAPDGSPPLVNMLAGPGKPVVGRPAPTSRPRRTTRRLGSWILRRMRHGERALEVSA